MGKFNIGDKVIINPTLKENNIYGNIYFRIGMKIPGVSCITDIDSGGYYKIEEFGYYYSEEMLLPVPLFRPGDKAVIRSNLKDIPDFPFGYCDKMSEYEGKTYTIKDVNSSSNNEKLVGFDGYSYELAEDDLYYSWPS